MTWASLQEVSARLKLGADVGLSQSGVQEACSSASHGFICIAGRHSSHCIGVHHAPLQATKAVKAVPGLLSVRCF